MKRTLRAKAGLRTRPVAEVAMGGLKQQLEQVLRTGEERAAHAFLKVHPLLVVGAFNRAWNYHHLESEYELGSEYRVDFLLLSADSGSWHVTLIELEPPGVRLFTKAGQPTNRLRQAYKQIADWQTWVGRNEAYFRSVLGRTLKRLRERPQCSRVGRFAMASDEVGCPSTYVKFHYHIVIGRSSTLSEAEREQRAKYDHMWGGPEIATYDRILRLAEHHDMAREEQDRRFREAGLEPPDWRV